MNRECKFCPLDAVERIDDMWLCECCADDYKAECAEYNPDDEPSDAVS